MKLSDDFENDSIKSGISLGAMLAGVLSFMAVLVAVVIMVNRSQDGKRSTRNNSNNGNVSAEENMSLSDNETSAYPIGESTLVSDDLDFWNMYKEDSDLDKSLDHTGERYAQNLEKLEKEEEGEDLSENGTKTEVILPDGTSQWVMINAYIEKNTYDYTGLVYEEPFMRYYAEGKKVSRQGIKIDDSYGVIDFERVEDDGIDYCMIRIGKRGYATGAVTMDDDCLQYMASAKEAGLGVGVYFYSQAANEAEAVEEANLVLQMLEQSEVKPDYPVVFDMELVSNDTSRTENLTKSQLTAITKAFCDTVSQGGYTPAVYGNKYWLLRKLDLTQLGSYNIWLSQDSDIPDYPYQFAMWEYKQDAEIDGIAGKVSMSISFIDYEMR
ncbi:MAG: GH25 family lysozyme [Lachnospiraceae bacterium]